MARARSGQSGFSLIEVLVAVFIMSVGVLGAAGLQLASLQNNTSAMFRTQAGQSISKIMDLARANRGQDYSLAIDADAPTAPNCMSQACSPTQLRDFDLQLWRGELAATLPLGTGAIDMNGGLVTVTIRWQDSRNPAAAPLEVSAASQVPL